MIKIITIEREYGCGAANIAATIADRLGWKLWDQEITDEIARRLKCKAEMVQAARRTLRFHVLPADQGLHARQFRAAHRYRRSGIAGCRTSRACCSRRW